MSNKEKIRFRDYVKIIIVIILLILCLITSFRSGQKFYELKYSGFDSSDNYVQSGVAKFYFNVRVRY